MKPGQKTLDRITNDLTAEYSHTYGSFISFFREESRETGVTQVWRVTEGVSEEGAPLGEVRWFPPWRKYAYFPRTRTVYEETCMQEIAHFCVTLTRLHRARRKAEKEARRD